MISHLFFNRTSIPPLEFSPSEVTRLDVLELDPERYNDIFWQITKSGDIYSLENMQLMYSIFKDVTPWEYLTILLKERAILAAGTDCEAGDCYMGAIRLIRYKLMKKYLHIVEHWWFMNNTPDLDVDASYLIFAEYYQMLVFIIFAVFVAIIILAASYFLVTQYPESEKLSTYECGFEPYEDTKSKFNVQFYVVAILFVLFDIEIILLLPWCLNYSNLGLLGQWSMIEFLLELGLGFLYVWCVSALDW